MPIFSLTIPSKIIMPKLLYFLLFCAISGFTQNQQVDSLLTQLKTTTNAYKKAKVNLLLAKHHERIDIKKGLYYAYRAYNYKGNDSLSAEVTNQLGRFHFFTNQLDSAIVYFENSKSILKKLNEHERAASVNISLGAILLRQGNYQKTIETLTKSASFFENNKDDLNAAKCYSNISSAFAELNNYSKAIEYSQKALQIFEKTNQKQFELITLPNLATQYYKSGDTLKAISNYTKAEKLAKTLNNKRSLSMIYNNLGSIYLESDYAKAKTYLEDALALKKELNLKTGTEITESNLGYVYLKTKEYDKAISYLKKALPLIKGKQQVLAYKNLKEAYKKINQIEKAFMYSEKARILNDSLLSADHQTSILDIQTKYETEKKEKEILQLQTENLQVNYRRKQNQNLLIGALAALAILALFVYTQLKNAKRKHIILEQDHTIKEQEFEQHLREQELDGIDAIIDAQEKERNKIAEDLHDNLGSKVATLKLYLESYDEKESFASFHQKIKNLMNETYSEIRTISKHKKFGTKIDKGLIPSTKTIAKQISDTKKIDIKVINIDANTLIDNTIEIQIFRILQELITNIIKHSKATEASIQFSEDNNILNIIVEDNGIGFNTSKYNSGIGLTNIEKRMQKINGELIIDSSIDNGATIILNIPI